MSSLVRTAGNVEYVAGRMIRRFLLPPVIIQTIGPLLMSNQMEFDPISPVRGYVGCLRRFGYQMENRTVLEIGGGATNGAGYAHIRCGAESAVVFEPYMKFAARRDAALRRRLFPEPGLPDRVRRVTHLSELADQSVDYICSNSVLEHVTDARTLFLELKRVLKADGAMVHCVDYRDHFFKYPYHFLKFSRPTWDRFLNPGDLPRVRFGEHIRDLKAVGFDVEILSRTVDEPGFAQIRPCIHPDFTAPELEAEVTLAVLLARKAA